MDGLSGAASVITVFGLALSSTREIYNVVSGIKSGPKTVQQIASTLKDLSDLLQQLTGCTDRFYLAADLEETVSKCARDLEALKHDLAKLSTTDTNRAVRLWKNVKVTLKERDLEQISARIQQHIIALSLRMQIIEGKRGSSHTVSLERVEALSSTQAVLSEKSSGIQERTNASVIQVNDSVQALEMTASTSQQQTLLAFEQLSNKIQHMSSSSTGQSETLNATCNAILELMKQHFPAKPQRSVAEAFGHEASLHYPSEDPEDMQVDAKAHDSSGDDSSGDDNPGDDNPGGDESLKQALDRLCRLAKEAGKTVHCEEAETILCDIQQVFKLLLEAEEKEIVEDRKGKRSRKTYQSDPTEDQLLYQREVKRIKGFMSASQSIAINEKASRPLTLAAAKYERKNTHYQRPARNGTVTFQARRKYRRFGTMSHAYAQHTLTDIPESLEASFTFLPNNAQNPLISVNFTQTMSYEGSFLKRPALCVSAILPENSEVFRLIERGDLSGLIQSLSLRKAFLTDRDLKGRCLLNHALHAEQPDICKFLIDEGADVQFLEQGYYGNSVVSSLRTTRSSDWLEDPEFLASLNRCRSLLFEAGADPMLSGNSETFLSYLLRQGTTGAWKIFLDQGLHFVDVNGDVPAKEWLFEILNGLWHPETIALLLRRQGKNGLPIQDLHGCLHQAIRGNTLRDQHELTEALILLVKGGADVYARDSSGRTVSQIACCRNTEWYNTSRTAFWDSIKTFNRDLRLKEIWMEVLSVCGYDPEEVISASVRVEELSDSGTDSSSDEDEEISTAASDSSEGDDGSTSDQEGKSDMAASQCCEADVIIPGCLICGGRGLECFCDDDVILRQPEAVPQQHYESFLLEGDAEVWSS